MRINVGRFVTRRRPSVSAGAPVGHAVAQPRSLPDPAADLRMRCRARLLVLASDLAELGIRPRVADAERPPYELRCWDPDRMAPPVVVTCGLDAGGRRLVFGTPGGEFLGDAQNVLKPGDTMDLAHEIARRARTPAPHPWDAA